MTPAVPPTAARDRPVSSRLSAGEATGGVAPPIAVEIGRNPASPDQASTAPELSSVPSALTIICGLPRSAITPAAHARPAGPRSTCCLSPRWFRASRAGRAEQPPGDELVVDEVEAPALVRKRQHRCGRSRADSAASSLSAPDTCPSSRYDRYIFLRLAMMSSRRSRTCRRGSRTAGAAAPARMAATAGRHHRDGTSNIACSCDPPGQPPARSPDRVPARRGVCRRGWRASQAVAIDRPRHPQVRPLAADHSGGRSRFPPSCSSRSPSPCLISSVKRGKPAQARWSPSQMSSVTVCGREPAWHGFEAHEPRGLHEYLTRATLFRSRDFTCGKAIGASAKVLPDV